ncbi:MAG: homoserine dehydrogenase [Candidatus Merdivicinus sp.]|jgi:homoserine dehydrogenase
METCPEIKVALLGYGTVGSGVYKLFQRQKNEFPQKTGLCPVIAKILVRDLSRPRRGADPSLFTDCWDDIRNDPEIRIVIEVTGGMEPAHTRILEALEAGKTVITANKDLMAEHGAELFAAAEQHGCDLLFEAAVAGGIPIIRPLKQCLAGNYISEIMGIVNGTTNYILTRMSRDGMDFEEALRKAQELGYAEADPTADIEGYDAARKLAIMASIGFNSRVVFSDVYTQGISDISAKDIAYAEEMGRCIKLVALARNTPAGIEVRVHPMLLPLDHPLATVNDSFNAVFVHGDAVDDVMFRGRGAGELPTASAILGDVVEAVRNIRCGCTGRIGCTCYKQIPIKKIEDTESRFFLRMQVEDRPGVLANVASVLGNNGVSIAQVIQKARTVDTAEIVVITDLVQERNFRDSLAVFSGMSVIRKISAVIRVYQD